MAKLKRINLKIKKQKEAQISEVNYPSLYIFDKDLPLDEKEIGDIFNIKAKIRFTGMHKRSSVNDKHVDYDFEIMEIEI